MFLFALGGIAGGAAAGFAFWLPSGILEPVPLTWRLAVVTAIALIGLLIDFGLIHFDLPGARRQIPESVFWGNRALGSLQFGFELGTGVRTFMTASAPLALCAALLLGIVPGWIAVASGAAFGLSRGLVPIAKWLSGNPKTWLQALNGSADSGLYQRLAGPGAFIACVAAVLFA
jgi:hypothetical protein